MIQNLPKLKKDNRGGPRAGSGRPKGSKDKVSIAGLLQTLEAKTNGKSYGDLLMTDFLEARNRGDRALTLKYHNLILNKVMPTLQEIEVTEPESVVEGKKEAFAAALAELAGLPRTK